ncbi:non-ribosomal peptide synthetase, partial [bacterium]|nr:non-ribosomal peptide synthetase [bacterium]
DRKALPAPDLSSRQVGDEYVAPASPIEEELCVIWREVLRIEKIGIHDNFFRVGGDSIISIQLVAKARQRGIHFAVKDIFNYPTIAGLSLVSKAQENILTLKPEQGMVKGDIPLTPIQHWFFEEKLKNRNHFNQASLLEIQGQFDPSLLKKAFEFLVDHHDVLRCRYVKEAAGFWKQINLEREDIDSIWVSIDFSDLIPEEISAKIEEECNTLQQSLNIENGPLIKVALFNCGPREGARLLIVIHHLVVDGVSWRILLEDLEDVYEALNQNTRPLLTKTHAYQQWSDALVSYATSKELEDQVEYWKKIQESIKQIPVDFDKGAACDASQSIVLSLTEEETRALLQRVPKAYRTQINDILLTALTLAIGDWTQEYRLSLSLEGHGREAISSDIDPSRTIGWFTSIFPVCLEISNPEDPGEAIKTVKEELRRIPGKGIGYGILAYLTKNLTSTSSTGSSLPSSLHPTLSFNYLGQWDNTLSSDSLFSFAGESSGRNIAEDNPSSYLLNINSEIRQGTFHISFGYSSNHYHHQTIDKIAKAFIKRLKELINHCSQDNVFGYTP